MKYDIKDLKLAPEGKLKIQWAGKQMPVLELIKQRFVKEKPLTGITLGACLHVTSETANLMITLMSGGAKVILCASNPLSTQDAVAASLVKDFGIPVFAIHGENNKTYYKHLQEVLDLKPNITMDDGGDLINGLHKFQISIRQPADKFQINIKNKKNQTWKFIGSSEETTTGVIRLKAMEKEKALKVPVIAVNDSLTKHLFDNRYGTGQSTIDGILRATNILLAGKIFVVAGYGWCSRGIASRAKGMGADVIVTEIDPVRALEAAMDGFRVMPMEKAVKIADILVTATGDKDVFPAKLIKTAKDGVILANAGHFNCEIDVAALEKLAGAKKTIRNNLTEYTLANKKIYLLGEGRLVNLACAEGHPASVMDMSFADQALAAEYLVKNKNKLENKVYVLPKKLDQLVASLKLKSMGIKIDKLTPGQEKYLNSWQEGT